MKVQLRRLRIWQKLLISSIAYLLPIGLLVYFVVYGIQIDIRIAELEIQGTQALAPLEDLMGLLANNERVTHFYLDGDKTLKDKVKASQESVSRAMETVLEVIKPREKALSIDPPTMKTAGLEGLVPAEINKRWEELRNGIEKLTTFQSDSRHEALIRDVQALKRHLGETSNLILDPELDTYYMMEVATVIVPQAEALLAETTFFGQKALLRSSQSQDHRLTPKEMFFLAQYATRMEEFNLKQIEQDIAAAIREDGNFHGLNQVLQENLPPALDNYRRELRPLTTMLMKFSVDGSGADGIENFIVACTKAMTTASELRRASVDVLRGLLQERIKSCRTIRQVILLLSFAAVVLAVLLVLFISRGITSPLKGVVEVAGEVSKGRLDEARKRLQETAPKGDLALLESEFESGQVKDEIWQLWGVFSTMAKSLGSLINQVRDSGIQVVSSATEISASARELEATASQQAASVSEVEATSREITSGSHKLARTMNDVAEVAAATAALVEEGHQGLQGMEATMRQLMAATASIAAKHQAISDKANNIGTIVTTITKVADQTNLLSLNAAIEAEKAGEYGLGFSVVAREIRRLADQTAVAITHIDRMVKETQSAVSSGVMEVDKFVQQVRQGVDDVQRISGQLLTVIQQVQALIPHFEEVNCSMESQSVGAEEISKAMTNLSDGAYQTKQVVEEFNRAVEQLTEAVHGLQGEVSRFTVEG